MKNFYKNTTELTTTIDHAIMMIQQGQFNSLGETVLDKLITQAMIITTSDVISDKNFTNLLLPVKQLSIMITQNMINTDCEALDLIQASVDAFKATAVRVAPAA